jgi:ribosomal protein S27AE
MSWHADKFVKRNRHLCDCGHRALFIRPSNGHVAFRRDHDLCPRCWRSLMASARVRGRRLASVARRVEGVVKSPLNRAA